MAEGTKGAKPGLLTSEPQEWVIVKLLGVIKGLVLNNGSKNFTLLYQLLQNQCICIFCPFDFLIIIL